MKSKNRTLAIFRSSAGRSYSELELLELARDLGSQLRPGARILLEGKLGAGKSTFARGLLQGLKIPRESEGSPTFPIAHEYKTPDGTRVVHIDLYRLDGKEDELEATGLLETLWDPSVIVFTEWLTHFEDIREKLSQSTELTVYSISLEFDPDDSLRRIIRSE